MLKFSVVIPVFNEEESLMVLHREVKKAMDTFGSPYEIIYVDDGSTDSSLDILKEIKNKSDNIRIISFKKNYGQSTALYAGFKKAEGEWIVTLDADLQNPPQEIVKLWRFASQADFITGVRRKRHDKLMRKVSSGMARFFRMIVLGDRTQDIGCSLRVFKREIVDILPFFRNFHRFFTYLVFCLGKKVVEVDVSHQARLFGRSKYSNFKRALEGIWDLCGVFWLKTRFIKYEIKYKC